jgi:5-methylcytosine-specific restriction endonuclease McrA
VVTSDATRAIPPEVRRFVAHSDGGCTIAGCHSRYRLQVHHIHFRSNSGTHDADNLTTLCWFHHHVVVHRLGFRINPESPPQKRTFLRNVAIGTDPPVS